jgi:hypothetical protein
VFFLFNNKKHLFAQKIIFEQQEQACYETGMSTQRPENSAILGVSMPLSLKLRIKRLADADKRTMASWAAIHLEKVVKDLELSLVAEDEGNASSPFTPAAIAPTKYPVGKRRKKNGA